MTIPILYSFRRCPYAIRARLALNYAGIEFELREVSLRNKPAALLSASPKGSVPVLILENGHVIDESIEIMQWAIEQNDPDNWGVNIKDALILENDSIFKNALDKYKYSNRYPDEDCSGAFDICVSFLESFERIEQKPILTQMAILPFIRQFANTDRNKFNIIEIPKTQKWLEYHLNSKLFLMVMQKYPLWDY